MCLHVFVGIVQTFWDWGWLNLKSPVGEIFHRLRQSISATNCPIPFAPSATLCPWLPSLKKKDPIERPHFPILQECVSQQHEPRTLSPPQPHQMGVIYLSLDPTKALTLSLWGHLLPDPCHLVFASNLLSTLKFCSLNTLFGSSVAPLQLLQLGLGYRLLPTEPEGTKSQLDQNI